MSETISKLMSSSNVKNDRLHITNKCQKPKTLSKPISTSNVKNDSLQNFDKCQKTESMK